MGKLKDLTTFIWSFLARSRFCAIAIDQNTIAIIGGEVTEDEGSMLDMKTYSLDQLQWEDQPSLLVGRKV